MNWDIRYAFDLEAGNRDTVRFVVADVGSFTAKELRDDPDAVIEQFRGKGDMEELRNHIEYFLAAVDETYPWR